MKAWKCDKCGKQEVTHFFKPKWVGRWMVSSGGSELLSPSYKRLGHRTWRPDGTFNRCGWVSVSRFGSIEAAPEVVE